MVVRSSSRFCLFAVLLVHPARWFSNESAPLRAAEAGDVSAKIDGRWQEFAFNGVNNEVSPCTAGCSTDLDSEPPGNSPPWTVKSNTSCLLLEVIEGYGGGQSVFEVINNEVSLGNTTDIPLGQGSTACLADPTVCYFDSGVGKGNFTLQKNVQHSIRIIPRRDDQPSVHTDRGWFRLKSVACGGPTCAKAGSICTPALTKCCSGLVCRKSQPATGQSRCLACAKARQSCAKNSDCCSKKCLKQTKKCAA